MTGKKGEVRGGGGEGGDCALLMVMDKVFYGRGKLKLFWVRFWDKGKC